MIYFSKGCNPNFLLNQDPHFNLLALPNTWGLWSALSQVHFDEGVRTCTLYSLHFQCQIYDDRYLIFSSLICSDVPFTYTPFLILWTAVYNFHTVSILGRGQQINILARGLRPHLISSHFLNYNILNYKPIGYFRGEG